MPLTSCAATMSGEQVGMIELPNTAGESAILWTDESEHDSDGSRLRLECVDGKSWLLHTERVVDYDDGEAPDIEPCAVPSRVLRRRGFAAELGGAFRAVASMMVFQFMDAVAKGSVTMPLRKPVKVARASGWWVKLLDDGSMSDGDTLIRLEFKRPLSAEEMMVLARRLGLWADAVASEFGDI